MTQLQENSPETDDTDLAAILGQSFDEIEAGGAEDATPTDEIAEVKETETDKVGDDQPSLEAPGDFAPEEAAWFATLNPNDRKIVLDYAKRSQASRTSMSSEFETMKQRLDPIAKSIEPYAQFLESVGAKPDQIVGALMPYYRALAMGSPDQKREAVERLINQFGVDLGQQKQEPAGEYVDPEVRELRAEIAELKKASNGTLTSLQSFVLDQNRARIESWKDAKDEKGNLLRPHFAAVESSMEKLIRAGLAKGLDDAYAQAVTLSPEIQKEIAAKAAQDKRLEDLRKSKEAEKAKGLNKKGASSPAKKAEAMSIVDAIEESYAELAGA